MSTNGLRSEDGPLVARYHVRPRVPRQRQPGGRVSRFVADYGWRAVVIPLLAVVTFVTLLDVASTEATSASALTEPSAQASAPVRTQAPATAEGEPAPATTPAAVESPPFVEQGTGQLTVVPGTSQVYGTGALRRFIVEVEDGINVDPVGFAAAVEVTLADPRGWGADGGMSFQRVDGDDYDFRVSLVSPLNMETFCPGVGTGGYTSCRYGERAVINLARWVTAVPDYAGDIETYRQYVVNHEVGHALGHGHEECPGVGELAPVMQQQTLGLDGCVKNPWPFPAA
ncbi:MAG: DUF3152 domain-containing protein [Geodermatophilaceae bacterium]|nr:DUF3152 domain-containing protein [Geodermatophilaceae bacterium]